MFTSFRTKQFVCKRLNNCELVATTLSLNDKCDKLAGRT